MRLKILCTFFYVATSLCSGQNGHYCLTEGDAGLIVSDREMGKDGNIGSIPQYLENVTSINLDITQWQRSSWNNNAVLQEPILDERWETFLYTNDYTKFQEILNNSTIKSAIFSVRIYTDLTEISPQFNKAQWYHLKINENVLYICETDPNIRCNETLDTKNLSSYEFYVNTTINQSMWILHEYYYFYSNEINATVDVYTGTSTSCSNVKYGWIKLHVAMCSDCKMSLELQSNDDTNKTETFDINGTGHWETLTHYVVNFTTCFKLLATTIFEGTDEKEPFWAIGDKLYFSKNENCANTTRYTRIYSNDPSNLICEDSRNNQYNITQEAPTTQCYEPQPTTTTPLTETISVNSTRSSKEKESEEIEKSSFNFLYLLIVIPVVILVGLTIPFCHIRKTKLKRNRILSSKDDENIELMENGAQRWTFKPGEKHWPPVKITDFGDYISDVFDPNRQFRYCYIQNQFSDLPSGFIKSAIEARKQKNADKNRCYDRNRVKLDQSFAGKFFKGDYINASYIQGSTNYKEYIIAQNPRANTVDDFWIMIWQERISYCVMVTDEQGEYFRYWPRVNEKCLTYGDLNITLDERLDYTVFQKYTLTVRRKDQTREIFIVHYHSWQDNDMDLARTKLLPFISFLQSVPHYTAPVLFHCRDGAGLSGTVVLCDIVLRSIPMTGVIDMYHAAKELMKSRVNAISHLDQYILTHWIIKDFLEKFY
ncbi:receptor-type tyrosine-protein phosphatase alpha-like isoform X2 [Zophobas morio]|uniref:receptor-type tyrosine-protein phosphatase alpha-like isoform X2 n=1 Tax=Zophobas morio TaxID=2755281 RepID=UPI003082F475